MKEDLPLRSRLEQMIYGAGKLWIALYRDHPTLGAKAILKIYSADGKS